MRLCSIFLVPWGCRIPTDRTLVCSYRLADGFDCNELVGFLIREGSFRADSLSLGFKVMDVP
jgi:hypothetical protein